MKIMSSFYRSPLRPNCKVLLKQPSFGQTRKTWYILHFAIQMHVTRAARAQRTRGPISDR